MALPRVRINGALLGLVAATSCLFACATVARANFVAVAEDPAGDSADPSPGRDITAVGLSYDKRSGTLIGAIRLGADPTDETRTLASLYAGRKTANGCDGYPAAGFGSFSTELGASWLRVDDLAGNGPRGDADKLGGNTAVQKFDATDAQLAGQPLDCVIATLSEPGNPANLYDTAGPLDLVGEPALALRIGGVPRTFAPGRPRTIKLTLSNDGDAPTGSIRLKLSRARGLVIKVDRTLKPIKPDGRITVKAKVTLSGRAHTTTRVKVTATAGKLAVRGETRFVVRKPGGTGGGGGGNPSGQWCTRWVPDISGTTGGSLIYVPC
jgi:hypothetical protein